MYKNLFTKSFLVKGSGKRMSEFLDAMLKHTDEYKSTCTIAKDVEYLSKLLRLNKKLDYILKINHKDKTISVYGIEQYNDLEYKACVYEHAICYLNLCVLRKKKKNEQRQKNKWKEKYRKEKLLTLALGCVIQNMRKYNGELGDLYDEFKVSAVKSIGYAVLFLSFVILYNFIFLIYEYGIFSF